MARTTLLPRSFYIPAGSLKVADKHSDAVAYVYAARDGRPCAMVFFGEQAKPIANYRFRDEARRTEFVRSSFERRQAAVMERKARALARSSFANPFKVGDILNTCWGYDQTNREFFEVVETKGKTVILHELAQETVRTSWDQGRCVPLPGQYVGERLRRMVKSDSVKIDDVRRAWKSDTVMVGPVEVVKPLCFSDGR